MRFLFASLIFLSWAGSGMAIWYAPEGGSNERAMKCQIILARLKGSTPYMASIPASIQEFVVKRIQSMNENGLPGEYPFESKVWNFPKLEDNPAELDFARLAMSTSVSAFHYGIATRPEVRALASQTIFNNALDAFHLVDQFRIYAEREATPESQEEARVLREKWVRIIGEETRVLYPDFDFYNFFENRKPTGEDFYKLFLPTLININEALRGWKAHPKDLLSYSEMQLINSVSRNLFKVSGLLRKPHPMGRPEIKEFLGLVGAIHEFNWPSLAEPEYLQRQILSRFNPENDHYREDLLSHSLFLNDLRNLPMVSERDVTIELPEILDLILERVEVEEGVRILMEKGQFSSAIRLINLELDWAAPHQLPGTHDLILTMFERAKSIFGDLARDMIREPNNPANNNPVVNALKTELVKFLTMVKAYYSKD